MTENERHADEAECEPELSEATQSEVDAAIEAIEEHERIVVGS
ncbi:hypothetical protein [Halosolutus halophilus]|nr:hypothetical protein [Halosolutus halophilus]